VGFGHREDGRDEAVDGRAVGDDKDTLAGVARCDAREGAGSARPDFGHGFAAGRAPGGVFIFHQAVACGVAPLHLGFGLELPIAVVQFAQAGIDARGDGMLAERDAGGLFRTAEIGGVAGAEGEAGDAAGQGPGLFEAKRGEGRFRMAAKPLLAVRHGLAMAGKVDPGGGRHGEKRTGREGGRGGG